MSPSEQSILKNLYELRDRLAKKLDKPTHYIINNRLLSSIVKNPPKSVAQWSKMKGVHPVVRQKAKLFFKAVEDAKFNKISITRPKKQIKRFSEDQKKLIRRLNDARESLSKKFEVSPHVILSKDEIKEIAISNSLDSLMDWQKNLLKDFI
jgi:ribonuclease D